MNQSEFNNKVQQKLDDKKVKDYVDDLDTQSTELPINIPDNPFMVGDGSDGIERDNELTTKQSMMFFDYMKRNGFKDFGEWWEGTGKEEVNDIYSEAIINNEQMPTDGNISKWWRNYLDNNLTQIIRQLKFIQIWVP